LLFFGDYFIFFLRLGTPYLVVQDVVGGQ